jgi:hypothetical protein
LIGNRNGVSEGSKYQLWTPRLFHQFTHDLLQWQFTKDLAAIVGSRDNAAEDDFVILQMDIEVRIKMMDQ